ncbi:MAG: replication protein RepA [Alphaproteobacteria bacterium]|nr:replication protein RepA [Alphaproteobacteria bacterium]
MTILPELRARPAEGEADALWYHPGFCQFPLPQRPGAAQPWSHERGGTAVTIEPGSERDRVPGGAMLRRLLMHLCDSAVRLDQSQVSLGESAAALAAAMQPPIPAELVPALEAQATSLFGCRIVVATEGGPGLSVLDARGRPRTSSDWRNVVRLNARFLDNLQREKVALDRAAVAALQRSAMALDIYVWLAATLPAQPDRSIEAAPWPALQAHFGAPDQDADAFQAECATALALLRRTLPRLEIDEDAIGAGFSARTAPEQPSAQPVAAEPAAPAPVAPTPVAPAPVVPAPAAPRPAAPAPVAAPPPRQPAPEPAREPRQPEASRAEAPRAEASRAEASRAEASRAEASRAEEPRPEPRFEGRRDERRFEDRRPERFNQDRPQQDRPYQERPHQERQAQDESRPDQSRFERDRDRDRDRDRARPDTDRQTGPARQTVSLRSHLTGLQQVVWLHRAQGRDNVVIEVTPGTRYDPAVITVLTLEPIVLQVAGGLHARDFERVSSWATANRDLIDAFWEGEIDNIEDILARVRKVPAQGVDRGRL